MLTAQVRPMLADFQSTVSEHPVAASATAMAIIGVMLFLIFGGGRAVSAAAVHAASSAFALVLLCAGFGVLFWNTFPLLFAPFADSDTLQHFWAPGVAATAFVLMLARLQASRKVRQWRTPPLADQLKAELRARERPPRQGP